MALDWLTYANYDQRGMEQYTKGACALWYIFPKRQYRGFVSDSDASQLQTETNLNYLYLKIQSVPRSKHTPSLL